jgi:quercetin dioxygenase-like cupin family protein
MAEYMKAGIPGLDENGFHRTGTLDYLILIEGQLRLDLEEGSAELGPGDIVVQRDTKHAWRNPDETPAKCLVIITRSKEARSHD